MKSAAPTTTNRVATPADRLVRPCVAIVGFTDHREQAFRLPAETWELWGLNEMHRYEDPGRFTRWFEIHDRTELEAGDAEHIEALRQFPPSLPVYMQRQWSDIPASVEFPRAMVEAEVGPYMTSSIAWEVGLAIAMGAREIGIYGVDMAQETEYAQQRPCLEYLIGLARGRGIRVVVPETSDLLKAIGQYGFDPAGRGFRAKLTERLAWLHRQDNDWLGQLRGLEAQYQEVRGRMEAEYREKREQLLVNRFQTAGAISDCEYWLRSWSIAGDGRSGEPTPDRTQDPRTGIAHDHAPSADHAPPARVAAAAPVGVAQD